MSRKQGFIFILSGPSGSGKTTLREELLKDKRLGKGMVKSISITTRPKRSKELDKKEYFFVSRDEFRKSVKAKKILEWTKYLGYYYATPKDYLEKQIKKGKQVIMCLDLKGALRIKKLYPENTATIFIIPPSFKALQDRIEGRCHKTKKEEVRERLKIAKTELQAFRKYDYCVVNRNLQQALKELKGIMLRKTVSSLLS